MAKVALVFTLAALLAAAVQSQTRKPMPRPAPKPSPTPLPNKSPSVKLVPSANRVTLSACSVVSDMCPVTSPKLKLSARAEDPDGDTMLYTYSTTGGRVEGEGPEVTLDLSALLPGYYTVTVEVDDGNGGVVTDSVKLLVEFCNCDLPPPPPPTCPTVNVSCPAEPRLPLMFTANVLGGEAGVTPTYNWTVSAGTITSGQGTTAITVDTTGLPPPANITAMVDVGGYDRSCMTPSSCSTGFGDRWARKLDEYGNIKYGDERSRLDDED